MNLQVDEKLHHDLPDESARVKIIGAPGTYEVDRWSPKPHEHWERLKNS